MLVGGRFGYCWVLPEGDKAHIALILYLCGTYCSSLSEYSHTIARLRQRLLQPLPGFAAQQLMIGRVLPMPLKVPENARQSAVLALLFPLDGELHVLLMKRREDNTAHSGQVSFPGGSYETDDADFMQTALREAREEVGIDTSAVEVLGALTSLYIPVSNFNVFPFVGYTDRQPKYKLSREEVSYVLEVPLRTLFHPHRKTVTDVVSPAQPTVIRQVNAYKLEDGTIIWGATAMILSELEVALGLPT